MAEKKETSLMDLETRKPAAEQRPAPVEVRDESEQVVNRPDTDDAVTAAREAVLARQDELNAANEEGHRKNMEAEDQRFANIETVEGAEGAVAAPAKFLGREDNGNTPRIAADGSKSWHPPGVAGVQHK